VVIGTESRLFGWFTLSGGRDFPLQSVKKRGKTNQMVRKTPKIHQKEAHDIDLTVGQAAALCGVTYNTFTNWRKQDDYPPPDELKLIAMGEYTRERVRREFARDRGEDLGGRLDAQQQRARKDKAQADRVEMENSVRQKELIEAEKVAGHAIEMVLRCRARLLRIPSAAAPLVLGQDDRVAIQNTIDDMIRDALEELSVQWMPDDDD
jgi:phage terminase Nu1 subunit (DNA packaging protein)